MSICSAVIFAYEGATISDDFRPVTAYGLAPPNEGILPPCRQLPRIFRASRRHLHRLSTASDGIATITKRMLGARSRIF